MTDWLSETEPVWKNFEIFIGWKQPKHTVKKAKMCMRCKEGIRLNNSKYGFTKIGGT